MELARALKALWRRKRLLAVGVVIAAIAATLSAFTVGIFPPSLTPRTNTFATASTQILVDTPNSAFANLAEEVEPLNTRAAVFSRFLASPLAIELIAREAKLPADAIEGQGPYEQNIPLFEQEPTAQKRSSEIIGEQAVYRLRFENNPELPIVTVFAQAPTAEEAHRLADAAPEALSSYIDHIQDVQNTPAKRRVEVRQLGDATGGVVNGGANVQIAALAFFVTFVLWCLLLIPAHTIARGWRDDDDDDDRPSSNGRRGGAQRREIALRPYLERSNF
jgi:capsular polysaccharide biosynthesis protein